MSLPIDFSSDGISYGLLFPLAGTWQMSFYSSEKGRRRGMTYLQREIIGSLPLYSFELKLADIQKSGVLVPFIPFDKKIQSSLEPLRPWVKNKG